VSKTDALRNALDAVTDSETFLAFVRALIADREDEVGKEKIRP
jgi:hypothetical protein